MLYGGRREGAKGWERLLDGFAEAVRKEDLDLHLVTFGVGRGRPARRRRRPGRSTSGSSPTTERDDAMAAAAAYVQPSALESFSRTIMEAWLAGTPVIANGASAVVRWHIERSGAGLAVRRRRRARAVPPLRGRGARRGAAALAKPGRDYVLEHYTWPVTLDRMEATLDEWLGR